MRHRAYRPVAMMLCIWLVAAVPVRAKTIQFADVVQAFVGGPNGRPQVDLRLRALSQSGRLPVSGATSVAQGGSNGNGSQTSSDGSTTGVATQTSGTTSIIATDLTPPQGGSTTVQTIDLGDVTGTVCDCGEIAVPPVVGGGFPKWPLLALAAIPLAFLGGDEDSPIIPPVPPPPPPPDVIPEPATLLLFGSSLLVLGAGARRRRNRLGRKSEEAVEEV